MASTNPHEYSHEGDLVPFLFDVYVLLFLNWQRVAYEKIRMSTKPGYLYVFQISLE